MNIPDCYEADRQAEARDLAYTARLVRRGRCVKCDGFLEGDYVLDLSDFGLAAYACSRCADAAAMDPAELEEL